MAAPAPLRYSAASIRRTAEDTAGIFLLTLPAKDLRPGQPLVLTLSAGGKGSRRWISVVPYTDAARRFRYEQCAAVEAR